MKYLFINVLMLSIYSAATAQTNHSIAEKRAQLLKNTPNLINTRKNVGPVRKASASSAVSSVDPTITDFPDVQIFPSFYTQSNLSISINRQNPAELVASATVTQLTQIANQGVYKSSDGGVNWFGSDFLPPVPPIFRQGFVFGYPSTAFDASGNLFVSTIDVDENSFLLTKSVAGNFNLANLIVGSSANSGVINQALIAADDQPASPYSNNIYCAWNDALNGTINLSRSEDNGNSFLPATVIASNYGEGANVQTGPKGEVYVCYADYGPLVTLPASGFGFVKSLNGGQSFSSPGIAVPYYGIRKTFGPDARFNGIRVNDYPSMAVDKSGGLHTGRIYVTYADQRTSFEDDPDRSLIELTYSDDSGVTWSIPKTISTPNSFQSFFPWITVDQTTGNCFVAYLAFDEFGFQTNTYVALSQDGGLSVINQKISDVSHLTQPIATDLNASGYAGDHIGVTAYNGKVYVAWADDRSGNWQAYVSEVDVRQSQNLLVQNTSLTSGGREFRAETIFAGFAVDNNKPFGPVNISGDAIVTFNASSNIELQDGVEISPSEGGSFNGIITPISRVAAPASSQQIKSNSSQPFEDALSSLTQKQVTLYPNPSSSILNVSFTLSKSSPVLLTLTSVNGGPSIKLLDEKLVQAGKSTFTRSVTNLKSGIYVYQSVTDSFKEQGKIIIQSSL